MADNARPRDAQAGWNIFRQSNYSGSMEDTNQQLEQLGFNPIAKRTYDHYRKLHRYGYQRYAPINQVDVETHRSPAWASPLRSRYRSRSASVDVQILVVIEDRIVSVGAETISISNAEMSIRLNEEASSTLRALEVPLEGLHVLVTFPRAPGDETRSAIIELASPDVDPRFMLITLAFLTPGPTEDLLSRATLSSSSAVIRIDSISNDSPDVLVRNITGLFEALDAARLISDEVLAALDPGDKFALPLFSVEHVELSSPLLIEVFGSGAVLGFFYWQVSRVLKLRQKWHEGSVTRSTSQIGAAEAQKRTAEADLSTSQARFVDEQTRAQRIKNDQAELRVSLAPNQVTAAVGTLFRVLDHHAEFDRSLTQEETQRVTELIENQGIPSLEKLFGETLQDLEIDPAAELLERVEEALGDTQDENESGETSNHANGAG